jgi:hypothetical protein
LGAVQKLPLLQTEEEEEGVDFSWMKDNEKM